MKISDFEKIFILDNHDTGKVMGNTDDFIFQGKRLCLAPGFITKENGEIEILEITIYERDIETGEFLHHKK